MAEDWQLAGDFSASKWRAGRNVTASCRSVLKLSAHERINQRMAALGQYNWPFQLHSEVQPRSESVRCMCRRASGESPWESFYHMKDMKSMKLSGRNFLPGPSCSSCPSWFKTGQRTKLFKPSFLETVPNKARFWLSRPRARGKSETAFRCRNSTPSRGPACALVPRSLPPRPFWHRAGRGSAVAHRRAG